MYYLISTSTVMVPSMLGVVWSRRKHLTYICLGSIILEKVIWHSAHRELSWERAKRQELREPVWLLVLEHWWALPMWLSLFSWSLSLNVIIWSSLRLLKALFSQVFSSITWERSDSQTRFVVISKTPINDVYFTCNVIYKNILRLDIAMHDTTTVSVIKTLQ